MNAPTANHCSGCGRELGLAPLGVAGDASCPRCNVPLTALRGQRGLLLDSGQCGGQFVEHGLLRDLLEQHEKPGQLVPRRPLRQRLDLGEVRYLGCPECRQVMNRRNFGGSSGIVVDVCFRHGTWFDGAELAGVLAFVQSGGPALPPNLVQRSEFRPTAGLAGPGPTHSGLDAADGALAAGSGAIEVAGELLSFVVELISD